MERCGGDRGKGFFWSIDEKHAKTLEEQEQRSQEAAAAAAAGLPVNPQDSTGKGRKKDRTANLEPALKRSIKGDLKGTPLPPPLTSAPLAFKGVPVPGSNQPAAAALVPKLEGSTASTGLTTGVFAYPSLSTSNPNPYAA